MWIVFTELPGSLFEVSVDGEDGAFGSVFAGVVVPVVVDAELPENVSVWPGANAGTAFSGAGGVAVVCSANSGAMKPVANGKGASEAARDNPATLNANTTKTGVLAFTLEPHLPTVP